MTTNNEYLKTILENLTGPVTGTHTDNWYLNRIATAYGCSYTGVTCNGKYYKDIAEKIGSTTYTGTHFNNYYLKKWAESLTGETYNTPHYDNFYLEIISQHVYARDSSKITWVSPPSNVEYGDFNASGILADLSTDEGIANANVHLVIGSTIVDTTSTNSNGEFTFLNSPVHAGTHSFKITFDGNYDYNGSESSEVQNVTIDKETTYLNVTSYSATAYSDGAITIEGELIDNDTVAHAVIGQEINIIDRDNDFVLDTVETDDNGGFVASIDNLSEGTLSLRVDYSGTDDYKSSHQDISVSVVGPYLTISADKPILSYADGDKATISATLHSSDPVGKTVSFTMGGSALGTGDTDSSGVAVCDSQYSSQGIGDIVCEAEVTVSGQVVSKTFVIRDGIKYIPSELTSAQTLSVPNLPTNFKCVFKVYVENVTMSNQNSAWLDVGSDSNNQVLFGNIGRYGAMGIFVKVSGSYVASDSTQCLTAQTWTELTYTYNNGVQTISDGTNSVTLTNSQITGRNYVHFSNVTNKIKEILFLPL